MKYVIELDEVDIAALRSALRQLMTVAVAQSRDHHTALGRRMWSDTIFDCLRLDTMLHEATLPKSKDVPQ